MTYDGHRSWQADGGLAVLLGLGMGATLYATWARAHAHRRKRTHVGAHAWLVPEEQARLEAQWTRQALIFTSESKHG
ncbi:MAG TPA: hypothetical protein VKU02_15505 [Gemmataceae bacterium]|nr:hypothetical protein [Gemmataceae bacterium]